MATPAGAPPSLAEFPRPSEAEIAALKVLLGPLRRAISPVTVGLENIPDERPLLFVGNHTIYGMLDVPFMFMELYDRKGIFLYSLGDRAHFKVPIWGQLLHRFGVSEGSPETCGRLMRAGATLLVFPGGAREVAKHKGELNQLIWKDRMGFARLAIEHGCTIQPFAMAGVDDAFDIIWDAQDILASPVGPLLKSLGMREDTIFPISKGWGPTPLPRMERQFYGFTRPIPARDFGSDPSDITKVRALRDAVRAAVENQLADLKRMQENDPERRFVRRALRQWWVREAW